MAKSVLDILKSRGFIEQITDTGLDEELDKGKVTIYAGFDPTAPSLHLGHVIPIMALSHFQRAGHKPVVVIGGGTGMIGDPSGKSDERKLLDLETIAKNAKALKEQFSRFLDFNSENGNNAIMVNNWDWLGSYSMVDFLREVGKHFSVNAMMAKESVRARLEDREQGISYTEFSYMILQAYDFYHLFKEHDCLLQIGGNDQWGNITAGVDLIRRKKGTQAHGLTFPLLTTSSGTKFGKTEKGAIWLDPQMTSPYKLYQYWINVDDHDVIRWLKLFTFLESEQLAALEQSLKEKPEAREAQRHLAHEFTLLVHGKETADAVQKVSTILFGGTIENIDKNVINCLIQEVPVSENADAVLAEGKLLLDLLVSTGLCKSKGAAKRLVTQGGAYINNQRCKDLEARVGSEHLLADIGILLRAGKKNYHLLVKE